MPFDRKAEYQAQLEHLCKLARDPAWKSYAWSRAKELDADQSGLYCGIAADLTAAIKSAPRGPDSGSGSEPLTSMKPR